MSGPVPPTFSVSRRLFESFTPSAFSLRFPTFLDLQGKANSNREKSSFPTFPPPCPECIFRDFLSPTSFLPLSLLLPWYKEMLTDILILAPFHSPSHPPTASTLSSISSSSFLLLTLSAGFFLFSPRPTFVFLP